MATFNKKWQLLTKDGNFSQKILDDDYDFGKASDDLIRYDKKNPLRGLRQIMTGYRKWAERYIDQCPAEKKDKKLSKWANVFRNKLEDVYKMILKKNDDE